MQINITVRNQSIIDICPCVVLAEDSQNYVTAVFTFLTDDWDNTEKTAQFQNPKTGEVYESILDSGNACTIRWEALADSGDMNVAVFGVNGGYRVTTNMGVITVLPTLSGGESDTPPSHDVYQQLLTMLGQKADNMTYSDSVLKLLSGSKELASVIVAGGGSSVQPDWNQNDSGAADYIKNRPFYDDTNVLVEWDGNTEGLVVATTTEEVGGVPVGTAMAYKVAEYMDPESFVGATEIDSDGWSFVITEEEITQTEGITYVGGLALADKSIVAQNISFPEAGAYTFTANDVYVSKVYTVGIVKLPNKYLNLDTALNEESENPVQNKAIAAATAKVPLMVRLSMGQGISFSESYDTIEQALESRRPVIGIVDSYKGEDLVLPYWDDKNNTVYFDISKANMSWKYGKIGRSGSGYDATEYAADLPALTPDGRETNAGCVIIVGSTGTKYQLKKLNATDVGALSGMIVTITGNSSDGYTADKTYGEILAAHNAGEIVYAVYDTSSGNITTIHQLQRCVDMSGLQVLVFACITSTDGSIIAQSFTVNVSNTWQLRNAISETVDNKVDTIDDSATNNQYPSALAVKNYVDGSAATPRQQMQSTDTTVTLQPNTLYVFPEMATLSVTLATPTNTAVANEYHFFFTSGATATVFSLAAADGSTIYSDAYSIDANMRYEVSVLDNVAYIKGVSMSEA